MEADRYVVAAPLPGTVVAVAVAVGATVRAGQEVVVIESMKLEHVVSAERDGVVQSVTAIVGQTVVPGDPLAEVEARAAPAGERADRVDPSESRPGSAPAVAAVQDRHVLGLDSARADAVARRRRTGQRTARENVADLCDPGTFVEYGPLAIAAQRRRRSVDDLIHNTPADGLVGGVAEVDGHPTVVMSYDYTVLAGTQGFQTHRKKDRLFELADRQHRPVVLFAEGGGGRPGDTDAPGVSGLDCIAFALFAGLSGVVPLVGVVSGRCFAGNAALLGCCDVIIATEGSNIGMGGPAMIEGGGLGVYQPEEIGPLPVQVASGVVDVA